MKEREDADAATREKLARMNRLYAMLSRINRCIVRAGDPHELYDKACRIAVEVGGYLFAWVGLVEPSGGRLLGVARAGAAVEFGESPFALPDESVADQALSPLRDGRPCILAAAALPAGLSAALDGFGVQGLALLPLVVEHRTTGVLLVAAPPGGDFAEIELRLLEEVGDDLSFALQVMQRDQQRSAAETKVQYLAYYDAQTGLPARLQFAERLAARDPATEVAVLVIRLRRYHGILQALGQAAGIQLARTVATRLETLLPTAVVGRLSESEFACQIDGGDGRHLVEETAWRIQRSLAELMQVAGREVFLDPFVGIAVQPQDGIGIDVVDAAVLAAADGDSDSDGVCRFFVAGMDGGNCQRIDVEAALRRALERKEFVLHYQPQLDLASGRIVGAEALLRWRRPGHGLVSPGGFIPLLEASDLIGPVGQWVIAEACAEARRWQEMGLPPCRVAVNLSPRQFVDRTLAASIRQIVEESGLAARWLELEVTESAVLLDAEAVIRTLSELRSYGISHSLDDFGTGYSSLSWLQRLPVSRIKIDQSFVANVNSNPQSAAIVRAVIGMAHSLGHAVIAEGVETEGQLAFLRGLGCEEMQGYYFSRPLPADDFVALLAERRQLKTVDLATSRERVLLLVDDEPHVLSAVRRVLRATDFRVLTASSAREAFELLAIHPVGVVVCDQRMAEMTGTEFLRRVRALHPDAVRIVLSGYTELNSVLDAVNRGAIFRFITKPWDDKLLVDALHDAFRLHDIERRNRELTLRIERMTQGQAAA